MVRTLRNNKILVLLVALIASFAMVFGSSAPAKAHDPHPGIDLRVYVGSTSESCVRVHWHDTMIHALPNYNYNVCPGQTRGQGSGDPTTTHDEPLTFYVGYGWCAEYRWNNEAQSHVVDARSSAHYVSVNPGNVAPGVWTIKIRTWNC